MVVLSWYLPGGYEENMEIGIVNVSGKIRSELFRNTILEYYWNGNWLDRRHSVKHENSFAIQAYA
jgi:hypothetical protein